METTPTTVTTSKQYRLNWMDLGKGLIVAALTPVIPVVEQSLTAGQFVFDWKVISSLAVGGLFAYLVKNFFTPAQTVIIPPVK